MLGEKFVCIDCVGISNIERGRGGNFQDNTSKVVGAKLLAPVVQRLDNAIHRINHYPADSVVCFVNTYPLDSDLSGG